MLMLKRMALGCSLIVIASAVLLFSDLGQRNARNTNIPRVAIFQCASAAVLDDGVQGIKDALNQAGYVDGKNIALRMFNAENDMPTANAIAKQITDGSFDLVFTVSTVCLQVVANANKAGKAVQVFGLVTDPYGAGVGINRDDPLDHPPHLVGLGSFQPVAESLQLAKTLFPGLTTVGAPWNIAEHSSEACVIKARQTAPKLGIKLLEANVDNSAGVLEASSSLVSRGAQALWVGCDMTINVAVDSVVAAAKRGRVPVFTNQPPNARRGALFDLGADYREVGRLTGMIGVKILQGADPAKLPVKNVVPESLWLNTQALAGLKNPWHIPETVSARAQVVVDAEGVHKKSLAAIPKALEGRTYKIGLAYFAPDPIGEMCRKGLFDGLEDLGFVRDKNLQARLAHAQGEIANIPTVLQTLDNLAVRGESLHG
jgi:putative tryptophan/tyrosine transport system substrate-binding protein